jgi:hypothetical protein
LLLKWNKDDLDLREFLGVYGFLTHIYRDTNQAGFSRDRGRSPLILELSAGMVVIRKIGFDEDNTFVMTNVPRIRL